ncbi:unnamed protein product [Haemonchus placei]|uniref:7TM_GPCR_Srx domain-containing protein n=1 Tax=Haemonchus placei TaxID=6290 RepID=A0A0N4VYA6_HAEPC|nr:unnamed protein product [Haemonchus placei]
MNVPKKFEVNQANSRRNVLWSSFILFGFSVFAGIIASGILSSLSELLGYDILSDFILRILEALSVRLLNSVYRTGQFSSTFNFKLFKSARKKFQCCNIGSLHGPVDFFFAALPLCSCLFYIVAFKKIRSMRRSSIGFEVTDKFERTILKQGFLICIFYTYSLDDYGEFYSLSQLIFYASMNLPPIGFPLIVFICSKEFRKLFLVNCSKLLSHTQTIHTLSTSRGE